MAPPRSKKRKRKDRRRFGVLFKLLFLVTVLAAVTLGATVFFQVEEVSVAGNQRYTAQEVVAASHIQQGDNLFRMSKNQVARDILEGLPYIQSLTIRRVLPNGVLITVTEWEAVARLETEEGGWLVSVGGKLLEQGAREGAITVTGLEPLSPRAGTMLAVSQAQQARQQGLFSLLAALEERGSIEKVSAIHLETEGLIFMTYEDRFTVKLPLTGDHPYKLRALEAAVADREGYERGMMDLTQNNYTVLYIPE